jgi:hypothetical protein
LEGYLTEKISKKSIIWGLDMGSNSGYNRLFMDNFIIFTKGCTFWAVTGYGKRSFFGLGIS